MSRTYTWFSMVGGRVWQLTCADGSKGGETQPGEIH